MSDAALAGGRHAVPNAARAEADRPRRATLPDLDPAHEKDPA